MGVGLLLYPLQDFITVFFGIGCLKDAVVFRVYNLINDDLDYYD